MYLHEVKVKCRLLRKGMWVSVHPRINLSRGQYEFLYAEQVDGSLLLYVEGPLRRRPGDRRRKTLRESDIKTVHVKTGARV